MGGGDLGVNRLLAIRFALGIESVFGTRDPRPPEFQRFRKGRADR